MGILDWLIKWECKTKWPAHVAVIRPHLVEALLLAFKDIKVKDATEKIREFNKLHHDHLRYMYGADDMNQIMDSLKNPIRVKTEVYRVAGQDELGKKLFGDTLQVLLSQECSKIIWDAVEAQLHDKALDATLMRTFTTGVHEKCVANDPKKLMKSRRMCKVWYRKQEVECRVDTILQEIELVLGCLIKECAVATETQLPQLHFEEQLIRDSGRTTLKSVEDSLLPKYKYARVLMNVTLAAFETGGADSVVSVVNAKKEVCCKQDPTFQMEANWLKGMVGDVGTNICEEETLACFPDITNKISITGCIQKLQMLQKSALVNFVPVGSGMVASCLEMVSQLQLSTPPDFSKNKITEIMSACVDRCKYFLSLQIEEQKKNDDAVEEEPRIKTIYGAQVLQREYQVLVGVLAKDEGSMLTPGHLRNLRLYWWLCEPDWKTALEQGEALLRRKHGLDGAPAPASGSFSVGGATSSASGGPPAKVARKTGQKETGKLARAATLREKVLAAF